MSQPKRWWVGLIPLGLIWAGANWIETPKVERDIGGRAGQLLAATGANIDRPDVSVSGRDITVGGVALDAGAQESAMRAAADLPGARLVHAALPPVQALRPYTLAAVRDGDAVTLSGFAPSAEARARILEAAREALAPAKVTEEIKLAAGAPAQFETVVAHGLKQLGSLTKGRFGLSDQAYSLEGAAKDSAAFGALSGIGSSLPDGSRAGTIAITAPPASPYAFAAALEGGRVSLTGNVPDAATREKLAASARAAWSGRPVDDRLAFASGAPAGFAATAEHGISLAGKLNDGRFSLSGSSYGLTGAAPSASEYDATLAAVRTLPAGATAGVINIIPPEVNPYVFGIRRLDDGTIALEGAVPSAQAREALLAQAAKLYPGAKIQDGMRIARTAPAGFEAGGALALEQAGKLRGAVLQFSGNALTVGGEVPDAASLEGISKALAGLPGGFTRDTTRVRVAIPEVKPFAFGIRRLDDGTLVLDGSVPSAEVRAALLAQAAKLHPGAKIQDAMQIARTAPAGFAAAAALALEQASRLRGAAIRLSDGAVSVAGEAADQAGVDAIAKAFAGLPGGFSIPPGANTVRAAIPEVKPFAFGIRRLDDGTLVLDGAVPSAEVRAALLAQAAKLYPGVKIQDAMRIARTAPAGFAAAAAMAMEQASKLKGASARLVDGAVSISGEAADQAGSDAIMKAFAGLPRDFAVQTASIRVPPKPVEVKPAAEVRIMVPVEPPPPVAVSVPVEPPKPPPAPEPVQKSAAVPAPAAIPAQECSASGAVYFDEGGRTIGAGEEKVLREILAVAMRCRSTRIMLEGHTNSHGDRASNIRLSSLRTFAVSRWLQSAGIRQTRIETLGFGEDRPALREVNEEAAAKNRRVEITVR